MAGRSRGSFWLMYSVSVWKDEDVLEVDGVDGCTALLMDLTPLTCILTNGQNGKNK